MIESSEHVWSAAVSILSRLDGLFAVLEPAIWLAVSLLSWALVAGAVYVCWKFLTYAVPPLHILQRVFDSSSSHTLLLSARFLVDPWFDYTLRARELIEKPCFLCWFAAITCCRVALQRTGMKPTLLIQDVVDKALVKAHRHPDIQLEAGLQVLFTPTFQWADDQYLPQTRAFLLKRSKSLGIDLKWLRKKKTRRDTAIN